MRRKVFSGIRELPRGRASGKVTRGCIVLEGGAFRGLYTAGVLDALMEEELNFQCTVGVSAGAINGLNYVSGQIGRSARVNLRYRHDGRYVGVRAFRQNHGVIGFRFLFEDLEKADPFDRKRFFKTCRRLVAVATNCRTGKAEYFEKGKCQSFFQAVQASASMPYVSRMVEVDKKPYLDGGCSDKIPYQWAIDQGFEKIIVVRTRPESFRRKTDPRKKHRLTKRIYHAYPELSAALGKSDENYNRACEELERLKREGRIYVISPSEPVTVGRLEPDMEKLGGLYYLGYRDAKKQIEDIRNYLAK